MALLYEILNPDEQWPAMPLTEEVYVALVRSGVPHMFRNRMSTDVSTPRWVVDAVRFYMENPDSVAGLSMGEFLSKMKQEYKFKPDRRSK